ncbi:MAG: hypothetical protein AAGA66_20855 [Bacteroidota bacterium]
MKRKEYTTREALGGEIFISQNGEMRHMIRIGLGGALSDLTIEEYLEYKCDLARDFRDFFK